jgi:hypothetical protein
VKRSSLIGNSGVKCKSVSLFFDIHLNCHNVVRLFKFWGSPFGATTFSKTALNIKILGMMGLFATLGINDIQHNDTLYLVSLC